MYFPSYPANTYYIFNLKISVIIASNLYNIQKKYFIKKPTVKWYCPAYNDTEQ